MDLSQARSASLALDLDLDDEEAAERHLFDARANYTPVYADEPDAHSGYSSEAR